MLIIDTEVYKDYFLFAAKNIISGKTHLYEMHPGKGLDAVAIKKLMKSHTTISFNGNNYDLAILVKAVTGANCKELKRLSDKIIKSGFPTWKICRDEDITIPYSWDHIDLIEVAPGKSSLKIYGGRMHAPKLQDLPIKPDYCVPIHLHKLIQSYCVNDLETTELLYFKLKPAIDLRAEMSEQYGMDLRSKSDAQIAETVIKSELHNLTGEEYKPPKIQSDYGFYYRNPEIIEFETTELQSVFKRLLKTQFKLGPTGAVLMPPWLKQEKITVGEAKYQMGIGGLHSCESSQYIKCKPDEVLSDWDVASYYPSIILQQQLAPKSLGFPFLKVYQQIVTQRIKAKKSGDKVTADTLKIAVNGSFGKLGSKYSALYAPDLLIQTTVTGQLALLMLIERLNIAGITVASANTDGIVIHHKKADQRAVDAIMWNWMLDTTYSLERTDYTAIASRDVNNYVAVKLNGQTKGKGVFAKPGLQKNPDRLIVYEAVAKLIADGTPVEKTIANCEDITKFCTLRAVKGGAVWQGEELGKAVRFYYSTSVSSDECIHYAINNNRVPNSAGAMPLMNLPDSFPSDVDYEAYLVDAEKLLCEVGYRHA